MWMTAMIYLLPHWEVKEKTPVWSVWIDLVRSSLWKNASCALVIGMW